MMLPACYQLPALLLQLQTDINSGVIQKLMLSGDGVSLVTTDHGELHIVQSADEVTTDDGVHHHSVSLSASTQCVPDNGIV